MNCPLCKSKMLEGTTVLTFKMESSQILVIKDVPALICDQCGEEFVNLQTSKNVEKQVNKAVADGISMGFLSYNIAA
jgi:YgiT-type zinc finger domain-containing protein